VTGLAAHLGIPVRVVEDYIGAKVEAAVYNLKRSDALVSRALVRFVRDYPAQSRN
jgi:hypothetical protein